MTQLRFCLNTPVLTSNGKGGENMKNVIKFLIVMIFGVLLPHSIVYAADTILSAENVSVGADDTIKVPVNINNNVGISAFGIIFEYDSEYLKPVSAEGGIWDNNIIFNSDYGKNQAFATGAGINNKNGDGTFIYINFKIVKDIDINDLKINLNVKQLKHLDGTNTSNVPYTVKSGLIIPTDISKTRIGFNYNKCPESGTIKVPVKIKNNKGISTFGICINYDSKYITPISVEKGIWNSDIIFNPNYGENKAFVTGASVTNMIGDGDFIYINFKINKIINKSTDLTVDIKQLKTADGAYTKDVAYTVLNGSVNSISEYSIYDVNKSGTVDVNDAVIILEYVLNKKETSEYNIGKIVNGKLIGDVDHNGVITAYDSALVLWVCLNS